MIHLTIYGTSFDSTSTEKRIGARVLIRKDGKILFSYLKKRNQYLLPGGGMEDGENPKDAAVRECIEECGLHVKAEDCYLVIDEFYHEKLWRNYYFTASIIGQTQPMFDEKEKELELKPTWVKAEEIERILASSKISTPDLINPAQSTILAVKHSHYRELCAIRIANKSSIPPIPMDLKDTLSLIESD